MKRKSLLAAWMALVCLVSPVLAQIEVGQDVRIKITGVPAEGKDKIDADYPVSD